MPGGRSGRRVSRPRGGSKASRKRAREAHAPAGANPPLAPPPPPPEPDIPTPSTSLTANILSQYHAAPGFARSYTPLVAEWSVNKSDLQVGNPITVSLAPSEQAYLGHLLFLTTRDRTALRRPICNYYLNGVYSVCPLRTIDFEIYWMLPPDRADLEIRSALTASIESLVQRHFPVSAEGLQKAQIYSASVEDHPTCPVGTDQLLDDLHNTAALIPDQLRALPYRHVVQVPWSAPAHMALQVFTSRQSLWHPRPADYSHLKLPKDMETILRLQRPVIRLTSTLSADTPTGPAWIKSAAFEGLTADACFQLFRECALYTYVTIVSAHTDKDQATAATELTELPPACQQLLQVLNAVQPTTDYTKQKPEPAVGKENDPKAPESTAARQNQTDQIYFTAVRNIYNPLQNQGQAVALSLHHPERALQVHFTIMAPRPTNEEKGPRAWHDFYKTALLVQSTTPLPLETSTLEEGGIPLDGPLYKALKSRYESAYISAGPSAPCLTEEMTEQALTLRPAPDASVVLAHASSARATSMVVALEDAEAYYMLATAASTTAHVQLTTEILMENSLQPQIATLTVRPHYRSILGGKYHKLMTDPALQAKVTRHSGDQVTFPDSARDPLTYDATKRALIGDRHLKIEWARELLDHPITHAFDAKSDEEHKNQKSGQVPNASDDMHE